MVPSPAEASAPYVPSRRSARGRRRTVRWPHGSRRRPHSARSDPPPQEVEASSGAGATSASSTSAEQLSQHPPSYHSPYPARRKLCVLLLLLSPHKEAPELPGDNSCGT